MDNLEEMDTLLERHNLPRLNHEEIENMNRWVISNKIATVIWKIPTNKSPRPDGFSGEFHKTFIEELTLTLLKLFQEVGRKAILLNSFYDANTILISKPGRDNK